MLEVKSHLKTRQMKDWNAVFIKQVTTAYILLKSFIKYSATRVHLLSGGCISDRRNETSHSNLGKNTQIHKYYFTVC